MTGPIAATLSTRSDSKRELDPQIHLNSPQGSAWAVRPWLLRFLWLKMTEDDPRWSKHSDRVIVFCHSWWTEVWQSLVRSIPECRCGHFFVQGFSSANRVDGTLIFYPTWMGKTCLMSLILNPAHLQVDEPQMIPQLLCRYSFQDSVLSGSPSTVATWSSPVQTA